MKHDIFILKSESTFWLLDWKNASTTNNGNLVQQFSCQGEPFILAKQFVESKLLPYTTISFKQLRKLQLLSSYHCISTDFFSNFIEEHCLIEELMINDCSSSDLRSISFSSECNLTILKMRSLYCVKATLLLLTHFPKLKVLKCYLNNDSEGNYLHSRQILSHDKIANLAHFSNLKEFYLQFTYDEPISYS